MAHNRPVRPRVLNVKPSQAVLKHAHLERLVKEPVARVDMFGKGVGAWGRSTGSSIRQW